MTRVFARSSVQRCRHTRGVHVNSANGALPTPVPSSRNLVKGGHRIVNALPEQNVTSVHTLERNDVDSPDIGQFFNREWTTYQKVVASDILEHRALLGAASKALLQQFKGPISLLDLGCGDASPLVSLLKQVAPQVTVHNYTGVDLSTHALGVVWRTIPSMVIAPEASSQSTPDNHGVATTAPKPAPASHGASTDGQHSEELPEPAYVGGGVRLYQADMLAFLRASPAAAYDVVYTAFAVHHLSEDGKQEALREVARVLKPGGAFLYIDVFLQHEQQTRDEYMAAYLGHVLRDWTQLDVEERQRCVAHISSSDYPVSFEQYQDWSVASFASTSVLHKGDFSRGILSLTKAA